MDSVEAWASREAAERGVSSPHLVKGFKEGVRAVYEHLAAAKMRKRLTFVPGGEPEDIFTEFLRG